MIIEGKSNMKKLYFVAVFGFLAGYAANDLLRYSGMELVSRAEAQTKMDWRSMSRDRDFRRAVLSVVDGNCYVDDGYIYC